MAIELILAVEGVCGFPIHAKPNFPLHRDESLILGIFWALFHLPLFLTHEGGAGVSQSGMSPLGFLIEVVALAILVTWIYNNTRGSVLLAVFSHAAVNAWSVILPLDHTGPLYWLYIGLICLAAGTVVVVFGPARLSRKPSLEIAYVTEKGN